jgi:aspartyl-tRNA(Asn)/glutamyl-tRNA(Gln) amidotransferase subunit B
MNDLRSKLNLEGKTVESCLIKPEEMSNLANKIEEGTINRHQANQSLYWMYHEGYSADEAISKMGYQQVSDLGALEALCDQAIANSAKAVAEYKAGKLQAINSIKGQVMKLSQGKANPAVVGEVLAKKLAQ